MTHPGGIVVAAMRTELRAAVSIGRAWVEYEQGKPDGMPEAFQGMVDAVQRIADGGPVATDHDLYCLLTLYRFYLQGRTPEAEAASRTPPEQRN